MSAFNPSRPGRLSLSDPLNPRAAPFKPIHKKSEEDWNTLQEDLIRYKSQQQYESEQYELEQSRKKALKELFAFNNSGKRKRTLPRKGTSHRKRTLPRKRTSHRHSYKC
jgi:hypothetical protein